MIGLYGQQTEEFKVITQLGFFTLDNKCQMDVDGKRISAIQFVIACFLLVSVITICIVSLFGTTILLRRNRIRDLDAADIAAGREPYSVRLRK